MITLSPLRYPGGKTQFYDNVVSIMEYNKLIPEETIYVEPFCGGAGVAIKLLLSGKVNKIVLNDFDISIFAFWHSILNDTNEFCKKILEIDISIEEYNKQKEIQKNKNEVSLFDLGFSTFFLNRTNRSGIISAGPIGGYSQKGKWKLNARFNKENLIEKIKNIAKYKSKIKLHNSDIFDFLKEPFLKEQQNLFIFFDPPYFNKGMELYVSFFEPNKHYELASFIKKNLINHKWITTYDICQEIFDAYAGIERSIFELRYSVQNKKKAQEFIFYNNLKLPKSLRML